MTSKLGLARQHQSIDGMDEDELLSRARAGDQAAIRALVRAHNRRLFRAARSIVRNDGEAEDVVQASYVKAFTHLDTFRGEAQFSTWLTRIAINEALGRLRTERPSTGLEELELAQGRSAGQVIYFPNIQPSPDPEAEMSRNEVRRMLEAAVDQLPGDFRTVFVLRDIEGMSTEETAEQLAIRPETVKTRLHRARRLLRAAIAEQVSGAFGSLYPFDGARCAGMADRVIKAIEATKAPSSPLGR